MRKPARIVVEMSVTVEVAPAENSEDQISQMGIRRAEEVEDYSPVFHEAALAFRQGSDSINPNVAGFDRIFAQAVKDVTGEDLGEKPYYEYFDSEEEEDPAGRFFIGKWLP